MLCPFYKYLNSRHPNIKLLMEIEIDKQFPFSIYLSVTLTISLYDFITSTYTGFLLNYTSFASCINNIELIKCLVNRKCEISNN